jgi:hypothetical protein
MRLTLIYPFPKEMYILMPRGETTLDIPGFLLVVAYGYCIEGG